MTSDTIISNEAKEREKARIKAIIDRCNSLFPRRPRFTGKPVDKRTTRAYYLNYIYGYQR